MEDSPYEKELTPSDNCTRCGQLMFAIDTHSAILSFLPIPVVLFD